MPKVFRINEIVRPRGPISRSTLYAHAAAGLIELRKIGGMTVIQETEWARYLAGEPVAYPNSNRAA